ncbi:spore germination protein [Schnuerera sp. xch1]|uniref:spore germination protein n=1 Tax=Schnuerera sp. xch1 TaxID=2874283 RepID=UPI001CBF1AFE|nr:spore germination protein [Schnuerera sp. xch1]MBZ2175546.1 spore germination protein [Schnuerera sp. xch1]
MISKKIDVNKKEIENIFNNVPDLVAYEFQTKSKIKMMACYIEGLIDKNLFDRDILKALIFYLDKHKDIKDVILTSKVNELNNMEDIEKEIIGGNIVIFMEGCRTCYTVELSKWDKRAVEQPQAESVVRGPKEGFIEDIAVNKVLLRRKIKNSNLIFEDYRLGKQTNTEVSIAYIKGIVNQDVLDEVKNRLKEINIDAVLESGYIEELIEDNTNSFFATVSNSEKPDIIAGKILEGRVAIFTDGTPHVLVVPTLFIEGIMSSEDYYRRPYFSSFLRLLRAFAFFVTIYLPGAFVALMLYHQEMIPTVLLISAAGAREGVPLPVAIEIIIMVIVLELTKESGLRLPKNIGATVSIVGALVLGQAAVQAKLIGALTVILISITALTEFIIPELVQGIVLYRLVVIFLGGFFGLYGVVCAFAAITMHIISLNSFGVPFGWPIAPRNNRGLKDTVVRLHKKRFIFRPEAIAKENVKRQEPPKGE